MAVPVSVYPRRCMSVRPSNSSCKLCCAPSIRRSRYIETKTSVVSLRGFPCRAAQQQAAVSCIGVLGGCVQRQTVHAPSSIRLAWPARGDTMPPGTPLCPAVGGARDSRSTAERATSEAGAAPVPLSLSRRLLTVTPSRQPSHDAGMPLSLSRRPMKVSGQRPLLLHAGRGQLRLLSNSGRAAARA